MPSIGLPTVLIRALPFLVIAAYVFAAPYTKVEESFTLHAVHDFIRYGVWQSKEGLLRFDHIEHPGPLPRSFIPSIILSSIAKSIVQPLVWLEVVETGLQVQMVVRLTLGLINASALTHLTNSIDLGTGQTLEGNMFTLLTVTAFHYNWYTSRTLPNFMASPFVCIALSLVLRSVPLKAIPQRHPVASARKESTRRIHFAITLLSATCSIIRAELALALAGLGLTLLAEGHVKLVPLITDVVLGGGLGAVASIAVDSWYWRRLTWPELEGITFNVVQGKSSEWGVSPFHAYFTMMAPKLLLFSLPLLSLALGPARARRSLNGWKAILLVPSLTMIGGMSALGHKEWRFVVYTVPFLNVLAAFGAGYLWRFPLRKGLLSKLPRLIVLSGLALNLAITALLVMVSIYNYPGGEAVQQLHQIVPRDAKARVYFTTRPLMTGASLFTFERDAVTSLSSKVPASDNTEYNKLEKFAEATPDQLWQEGFDYVVAEDNFQMINGPWTALASVEAFSGLSVHGLKKPQVRFADDVVILGREPNVTDETFL